MGSYYIHQVTGVLFSPYCIKICYIEEISYDISAAGGKLIDYGNIAYL